MEVKIKSLCIKHSVRAIMWVKYGKDNKCCTLYLCSNYKKCNFKVLYEAHKMHKLFNVFRNGSLPTCFEFYFCLNIKKKTPAWSDTSATSVLKEVEQRNLIT